MEARPLGGETGEGAAYDAGEVLREIAKPRLTGSAGAAEVTAAVRRRLEEAGYDVQEQSFRFNPWPGRFGVSAAGVLYTVAVVVGTVFLYGGNPYGALGLLLILLFLVGAVAGFAGPVIDRFPWGCQVGVNLLAMPADARPQYLVLAHRDSKSQPVPLAFRGPAIVVAVLVWLALVIAAVMHTTRPLPAGVILGLGAAGVLAGLGLVLCWVDNRSPGALDNASGVAAALGIAERERANGDVVILITDAEELGLAGARAAARELPPLIGAVNLDGIDDEGTFYILERFGIVRKQGLAPHLAVALLQEAAARGEGAERRDLPFGIPVDHIPIVRAGTPAVTVMRGSLKSLQRVHRPDDDLDRLRGDGVIRAIELVSGALERLRTQAREQARVLEE